ncbi:tetratricopeptide repeat protein [Streptomyces sp. RG80]|uniref:tetratricopeptide repeat protein n=1 Tax=Streptomyces sp. RG80 TaxID=3157340 RepID=UPI00338FC1CB
MSRLSREKREQQGAGQPAVLAAPSIDVVVGAGGAAVGGVPVAPIPGEEIHHTVLNHLHRIALATGHPVHATVHDDRIGYVVALRIDADGSSQFTAEPVSTGAERTPGTPGAESGQSVGAPGTGLGTAPGGVSAGVPGVGLPGESGPVSRPTAPPAPPAAPTEVASGASAAHPASPPEPAGTASAESPEPAEHATPEAPPHRDKPTHLLHRTPEPPTFPIRALPDPDAREPRDAVPTFRLRAVPEWVADAAPGTVAPPTGQFGPPPVMDTPPATDVTPTDAPPADARPEPTPWPEPASGPEPAAEPEPTSGPKPAADLHQTTDARPATDPRPATGPQPTSGLTPAPGSTPVPAPAPRSILGLPPAPLDDPDPKPTPPRGFDAVAEAVLGDDPVVAYDGGGTAFLAGPMVRINEAVKAGRIEEAARLAEQTVAEASRTLGQEHPEVQRLLELTAYIAYLAGDPVRAFGLSLDLARTRHHARNTEAAYGNVQSAATAWRAVRDPEQGLRMGVELIGLWTELTRQDGTAVEDIEELDSARARMARLAERARKLDS